MSIHSAGPVLSIVVPTRNRSEYARYCLKNLISVESPDFEVVVQDNSDNDSLGSIVRAEIPDQRIKYFYTAGRMSQVENCEIAVSRAKGLYVALIGDDDGINAEVLDAAKWAAANKLPALTPGLIANYVWPGVRRKYASAETAGDLTINEFSGRITAVDAEQGALQCVRRACSGFIETVDLIKIYYGVVRRDIIDAVKSHTGQFFNGVSPDMAGAIALSLTGKKVCAVDYPLFLPGTSSRSMAGVNARKEHVGRLEDQAHLPQSRVRTWPAAIPKIFTVETVWGEAAWCAAQAIGRPEVAHELNLPRLCAQVAVFNPKYAYEAFSTLLGRNGANGGFTGFKAFRFAYWWGHTWSKRARILTRRVLKREPKQKVTTLSGIPDIYEAGVELARYLKAQGKSFEAIANR
jgi:glycosyltransferase involved in cell wall biosynthesis